MNRKEEVTWLVQVSASPLKGTKCIHISMRFIFFIKATRILKTRWNESEKKLHLKLNVVFRILLMINVQGAVFKLAHCLTRRAHSEQAACLPVETLLCVWLPWLSSVCFVPPFLPLFSLPSSLPFIPSLSPGYFGCGDEPPVPLYWETLADLLVFNTAI